jgi:hypothetical protein
MHEDAAGTSKLPTGREAADDPSPTPRIEAARRYLELLAGSDAPHTFQPYHDQNRRAPETGYLSRRIHGHLHDVWPTLMNRQRAGAAVAVTIAETDERGRKSANMVRPRAVWIEADTHISRPLPLQPTMTVETSPGRYHYIFVTRDITWEQWNGVQQTLIADYGSDPKAGHRTQVLRMPGTLNLKNPAKPFLVRFVEELTSQRIYTAAEIVAAFPPRPQPERRSREPYRRRDVLTRAPRGEAEQWQPDVALSAFQAIDRRLQGTGAFRVKGDRPGDQEFEVNLAVRSWWLRAMACIHHGSGGSEEGFRLSWAVSRGESELGLIGCRSKFDADDQRRVWDSIMSHVTAELPGAAVTMRTIYWIAVRYCGWKSGRLGRPIGQPRAAQEVSDHARAVAEAGQRAVTLGLERTRTLNAAFARLRPGSLMQRLLQDIGTRLDPRTGVASISSLAGMASTLRCAPETLRKYLRKLEAASLIVKNEGNSTSMLGVAGITIALALPEGIGQTEGPQQNSTSADLPISEQTGKPIPQFPQQAGWNPSRSPTSHGGAGEGGGTDLPADGGSLQGQPVPLPREAEWSLEDWVRAGVVHAEFGGLLELVAAARGKKGVSRVLVRLQELRVLRPSFADLRREAERAADIAARSTARKAAKSKGLADREIDQLVRQATPASVPDEDAAVFVKEMARHLDAIIREASGDPDPWRRSSWQGRRQPKIEQPKSTNAYAAARHKRDPSSFEQAGPDAPDDPPF